MKTKTRAASGALQDLENILEEFSLTKNEVSVYSCLIEHGPLNAKKISALSKVPRVRAYQTLDGLCEKGLVSKKEDSKIAAFQAVHPEVLNSYIKNKAQKVEQSKAAFENLLPLMVSGYNKGLHRPSISFYEGVDGFRSIYEDMMAEGKTLHIIASSTKHPEYQKIIQEYKKKEERAGIKRLAIVSRDNKEAGLAGLGDAVVASTKVGADETKSAKDKNNIKKVLREDLNLPGQIVIYGDKVAITNFIGDVSHFVIENKAVSEMFREIFSFMWKAYNKKLID